MTFQNVFQTNEINVIVGDNEMRIVKTAFVTKYEDSRTTPQDYTRMCHAYNLGWNQIPREIHGQQKAPALLRLAGTPTTRPRRPKH